MPRDTNDVLTKQKKGTWDPEDMHKAVEKVLNNEMSARHSPQIPISDFVVQSTTCVQPDFRAALTELSPVPDASKRRATAQRRKAERSEIMTSSPYKKILEEKRGDKRNVESAKRDMKFLRPRYKNVSGKGKKGKGLLSGKDVSKKTTRTTNENLPRPYKSTEQETVCPLCAESHDEDWIQCGNCKVWVHEACANISELSDQYICDYCVI